jgi:3-dehydroquinate dehydratase
MSYTFIDNSEKIAIVESQIRTIEYSKYSNEIAKIAEQAKSAPDAITLLELTNQIAEKDRQIAALNASRAALLPEEN